jgi:hypothetical protein
MALLEDLFTDWGWGTTGLVGLGTVLLAPTLLPVVGAVVRPVVKGLIYGTLAVAAGARELLAETGEQIGDLYAEARHEYTQGSATPATPRRSRLVTPAQPG